jgi:flagellar basal body-associated protein FliL
MGGAGGLLSKKPVLQGGVMIVEAVVLFAGFKFLGGGAPQPAAGAELIDPAHPAEGGEGHEGGAAKGALDKNRNVEINVVEFRAQNKLSGRTFLYDVSIWVVTKGEFEEKVRAVIKDREALIKDRVRTIIAQSDPEKLGGGSEPGLETLRRQVKHQLDDIIGDGMVQEVLIPRCIPFRTDF